MVVYEQIFVADESSEGVQRAVRIALGWHEALVELVRDIAVQQGAGRPGARSRAPTAPAG